MPRPDICLSIGNVDYQTLITQLNKHLLTEIRIDLLQLSVNQLIYILKTHQNLIVSYRNAPNSIDGTLSIYTNAIDCDTAYIDIDTNLPETIKKDLLQKAHYKNTKVILSYHNFVQTPEIIELDNIIRELKDQQPDIVKIACAANTISDCSKIMSLYEKHSYLIAFCMGEVGKITRIAAPVLGAPFTYACISDLETAPGQLTYEEIEMLLNKFKPM